MPTAIWKSRLRSGSAHWDLELAVEVRQCPLRSGSRGWGPAVPTATWKSRLRSGSAHCDLEVAVEVRQCPLGSGARGGGPAVPTGIWTARRRRRVRRWRRRRWSRGRRRRRRTALIKSNNPHLAGGEKSRNKKKTKNIPNSQKQKQLPNTQWVKYVYCPALLSLVTLEVERAMRNHSTNTVWKNVFPKAFAILWPIFPKLVRRAFSQRIAVRLTLHFIYLTYIIHISYVL